MVTATSAKSMAAVVIAPSLTNRTGANVSSADGPASAARPEADVRERALQDLVARVGRVPYGVERGWERGLGVGEAPARYASSDWRSVAA